MTAHNPWSRAFREDILRRKAERTRQEEEARRAEETRQAEEARRQTEEACRAEEARRAEETRQAEEARDRQKREEYERLQQETQKRQKCDEEDRKQAKIKEIEDIKSILKADFTNPYKPTNFVKLLDNLQYLHSTLDIHNIEYFDILSINKQADIQELRNNLTTQISNQLPKSGNSSAFITMIEDEYAIMFIYNSTEGIKVKFNDPRGITMPDVLKNAVNDTLGVQPIDFCARIDGPSSLIVIQTLLEFISSPNLVILIPETLTPEQNKLLRLLHVLYSCDLIKDIVLEQDSTLEAEKLLNIFYTAHSMKDAVIIEASARAMLNYYLTFTDIKDSDTDLLKECQTVLSALPISKLCSNMIRSIMQELTKVPTDDKVPTDEDDNEGFVIVDEDFLEETVRNGLDSPIFDDDLPN